MKTRFLLIFLMLAGVAAARGDDAGGGGDRIAWIDLPRVMQEYTRAAELVAEFEKEKAAMEAEVQEEIDKIERMEGEMLMLTEEARAARMEEVLKRKMAVNRMIEESERLLSRQSLIRQAGLLEEISQAAERVARREGYGFVLRGEVLLYKEPVREITDRVIEELNRDDGKKPGE